MQPFMQVNIQNPNCMGPWYSLRPTSCSTLPGEGGICFHDFCVCHFFKGKPYIDIQYLKRSNIWSSCLLEISSFFWTNYDSEQKTLQVCKSTLREVFGCWFSATFEARESFGANATCWWCHGVLSLHCSGFFVAFILEEPWALGHLWGEVTLLKKIWSKMYPFWLELTGRKQIEFTLRVWFELPFAPTSS